MKADTDNGYLKIANELIEAITRHDFSKREYKILLAVIRKTYGYNKKSDDIARSQIIEMTGLESSAVRRSVRKLTEENVLLKQQGKYANNLGINKNYGEWSGSQNDSGGVKTTGGQNNPRRGSQNDQKGGVKTPHTKDNQNTIPKDNTMSKNKFSDTDMKLVVMMFDKIKIVNPSAKKPNFETWANVIRMMRQLDDRTTEQIEQIFLFANSDDFWCTNILSPIKLRKHFDQLTMKRNQNGKRTQNVYHKSENGADVASRLRQRLQDGSFS